MTQSVRTILVLTCAACFTWLGLSPPAAATPTVRRQGRPELTPTPLSPRTPNLEPALDGARQDARATVRECEGPCLGCAASLLGVAVATAGTATACGGAVFSGGLTLAACWITMAGTQATVLVAATKCAGCDSCLNPAPDPETPPGGGDGPDECLPCDPNAPLADCLDPEIDWCEDVAPTPDP